MLAGLRDEVLRLHAERGEAAGILLGYRNGSTLQIADLRPIWRQAPAADSFALTEVERRQLRKSLAACAEQAAQSGFQVVGWFRANRRGGAALSNDDLLFHDEFFPAPWQIAVAVRPANQKPCSASVYMKDAAGEWAAKTPLTQLALPHEFDANASSWFRRRRNVRVVRGLRSAARLVMPLRQWALYVAALLVAVGIAVAALQALRPEGSESGSPLALSLVPQTGRVEIRWRIDGVPARVSSSAFLTIGGERVNLTEDKFRAGVFVQTLNTNDSRDLEIRLNAGEFVDSTHLIRALR